MRRTVLLLACVVLLAGILPSETFAGSSYSLDCQNTEQTIWVTKGEPVWLYFNPNRSGQHYIFFMQFPAPSFGSIQVMPFWQERSRNGSWQPYPVNFATTTINLWSGSSQVSYRFKIENQTIENEKGLSVRVACAATR